MYLKNQASFIILHTLSRATWLCTTKTVVSATLSSRAARQTSRHLERNHTSCKHESSIRPFQSSPLQNCIAVKDLQLIIAAGINLASSSGGSSRREGESPGPKQRANAFCVVLSSRSQRCRSTHLPCSLFTSASKGRSMKRCTRYAL